MKPVGKSRILNFLLSNLLSCWIAFLVIWYLPLWIVYYLIPFDEVNYPIYGSPFPWIALSRVSSMTYELDVMGLVLNVLLVRMFLNRPIQWLKNFVYKNSIRKTVTLVLLSTITFFTVGLLLFLYVNGALWTKNLLSVPFSGREEYHSTKICLHAYHMYASYSPVHPSFLCHIK